MSHSVANTIVRCESLEFIKPIKPSKHQVIELSPFDNLAPTTSFHFQFVYKNEKKNANFMRPETMKVSLAKLLVDFPLMAGTANVEDRKWFIECNDVGVPFIVAHADMRLDDFDMGDYDQLPKGICTQWTKPDDPVWQVQITYFTCGGIILVSEMLHQLGDAETNSMIIHKWAKIHNNQPYVPPVLDRTLIRSSGVNPPPTSFPLWHQSDEAPDYEELFAKLPMCTAKLIEFSAKELQEMKKAANSNTATTSWISTNDALCSHLWRLITKARGLPSNSKTCLLHACNVRKKIQPPLPSDYVGYVVMNGQTDRMTVNELITSPLSHAATFSRKAINQVTPAFVQSFIDWITVTPKVKPSDMNVLFGTDVFATSWVSFDLYSIAFEDDETPYFVGEIPTILDGVFKLVEGKTKGSISIQLSLLRVHMDKLLADPELHKYA